MKTYGTAPTLDGCQLSASRPCRLTCRKNVPGAHCTGDWVGSRFGRDTVEYQQISCPCRESIPAVKPVAVPTELSIPPVSLRRHFNVQFWTSVEQHYKTHRCLPRYESEQGSLQRFLNLRFKVSSVWVTEANGGEGEGRRQPTPLGTQRGWS
jgi:hypothetical protein